MTERPILFSGPMVRAILEGRKSQTRRLAKPQPNSGPNGRMVDLGGTWGLVDGDLSGEWRCPYGAPGDRLWVRERHCFLDVSKSALSQFPLGPQNNNERGPDIWNLRSRRYGIGLSTLSDRIRRMKLTLQEAVSRG